ncbi:MAG: efflux RND transporter permease subunit [Fibrobacterales bacterium]|nr:efflux RND transporter permease subunit [Fibrobacterales bacterium]
MNVAELSVRRPVLMTVLGIGVVLLGLLGFARLGVREYPNVDSPVITVTTAYDGANAAVVVSEVTEVLEESINSANGIKSLVSSSTDGRSRITVEFEVGFDLETAANDIRDRVSRVQRRLPDGADAPTISKADGDSEPIMILSVMSDVRDAMEVSEIARNQVKERLQTIDGVSEVAIWGEKRPVVRLWLDPVRMAALGVAASDVRSALARENTELPSGRIEGEKEDLSIRTLGRLGSVEEFRQVALRTASDGRIVRLGDVADVRFEPKDPRKGWKRNGRNTISLAVVPQPGANHIKIANAVRERLEDLRRDLPGDVALVLGMDASKSIRASIREVFETILVSFLLVVAVIFVFLRDWRTTLIPVAIIPIAVVGSVFVLYLCGFSINVLTLLGMVLAIGLVVDDAIVIVENIHHKIERGMAPKEAAVAGTKEIFFAVVATSVALMAVFLPLLTLGGVTGLLFREFDAVMIGTVFISTLIALTLSPMLCSKILRKHRRTPFFERTEPFFVRLNGLYAASLDGALKLRALVFPFLALLLGLSLLLLETIPREMAPMEDRARFMANLRLPEGTGVSRTRALAEDYASAVTAMMDSSEYVEVQSGIWGNSNTAMLRVTLADDAKARRPQAELAAKAQALGRNWPDMRVMVFEPQTLSVSRGGLPVQFVLQASDLEELRALVPEFVAEAQKSPVFTVVNTDLVFTKPELHLEILRDKAREAGVSAGDIAGAAELALGDVAVADFYLDGRRYDVVAGVGLERRRDPQALGALSVRDRSGEMLPLENFVAASERSASPSIPRYNRFNAATVSAGLAPGKTVGEGIAEMRKIAARVLADHPSVGTALAGSSKEFQESSSDLFFVFFVAVAFIFLVLAGQFESFRAPFVTLLTVPLALAGSLGALWAFGVTLNIFSEIALILLVGIVAKNGILIVEFANQIAEKSGCSPLEAAREAAKRRFRPILMTSVSTILGAVPLIAIGSPSRFAMGVALVGGLAFATFLTLFVVPAAYSYVAPRR